ncbi:MAG TPA: nucleotidyltransferase family protein [Gemmatimonadales bacterium]|nr:nucleotidyltransferase family protein [Gemmatimonadales bacterium]
MSPISPVPARFHRLLEDAAERLGIRGPEPALELAGRFGFRRFIQRHVTGDAELVPGTWLDRAARLRKEAREVSAELESAGVPHCFFKGIALLGRFYRLDDRRLDDVDLLVDFPRRNAALAVLHARGYAELQGDAGWQPAQNRPGVTMYLVDPTTGERDPEAPLLDVHWGLEPVTSLLTNEGLTLPPPVWARVEYQHRVPVLPDEHQAALVLHHLVRHDLLHIRGLLDLALLWEGLPQDAGKDLTELAGRLGVGRALRVVARVLVDDLLLFPLRGVRLGGRAWRDRAALRHLRLRDWLTWAGRRTGEKRPHVTLTRSLAWRRWLLADAPRAGRMASQLLNPPPEYLAWRWPREGRAVAWRRHVAAALRS